MSRKLTASEREGMDNMFTPISVQKATAGERFKDFVSGHRKALILGAIAIAALIGIFIFVNSNNGPDVKVLFVSSDYLLPEAMAEKLEDLLVYYTEDVNNDTAHYPQITIGYHNVGQTALSGDKAKAEQTLKQALQDPSFHIVIADPGAYEYLVNAGYAADNSECGVKVDGDRKGLLLSDTDLFTFKASSVYAIQTSDYDNGLSEVLADYHVFFMNNGVDGTDSSGIMLENAKAFFSKIAYAAKPAAKEQ